MVDEIINIKENIKNKLKFTKVDYESKCVRIADIVSRSKFDYMLDEFVKIGILLDMPEDKIVQAFEYYYDDMLK